MSANLSSKPDPAPTPRGQIVWHFRTLLLLYLVYLGWRAWHVRTAPYVPVDWGFQTSAEALAWVRGLVFRELRIYLLAFLLGLLTPPAWTAAAATSRRRAWLDWFGYACFGLATIAISLAVAWNEWPPLGSLMLPLVCFLIGARLGSAARRGVRPLAWASGQLAIALLLLVAGAALAGRLAVATAPLQVDAGTASVLSKQQLAARIRETRSPDGQPRPLRLSDTELSALVNSALGRGGSPSRARVHFEPATFTSQAAIALPGRPAANKFVNVELAGQVAIEHGHLHLNIDQFRVGRLSVPKFALRMLSATVHATLLDDPQIRRIIEAIDGLTMEPGAVTFVFQPGAISCQIVPSLAQLLWERPDVATETGIYLRHLVSAFERLPADADRFEALTRAAFALALERSATHDPLLENRAAIFALAILLGHSDLEPFVGEIFDAELRAHARRIVGTVTLRGRDDWTRHFWVSAGLILLSNEATSDHIGRLKEQLDSNAGGTGFSFADMLANFAGNRLAIAAVRDRATARGVQSRLAGGFDIDLIFPSADGLPENIPAAELASRYGGVGGPEYNAVLADIQARLAALPPL
ncbi:MAG: hypothetical protein AB7U73_07730 [Pirellulales bacterium]